MADNFKKIKSHLLQRSKVSITPFNSFLCIEIPIVLREYEFHTIKHWVFEKEMNMSPIQKSLEKYS